MAIALNEAAKQRLAEQSSGKQAQKVRKSNVSYKNRNQMPQEREVKDLKIFVGTLQYMIKYIAVYLKLVLL